MFTGIIETTALLTDIRSEGSNRHFCLSSNISHALHVDQSVSHDGVCLTVTQAENGLHWVTAIDETLQKTTLGDWRTGRLVNLERCMAANGRFDGHIVQGHVDQTARVVQIVHADGSWLFDFSFDVASRHLTVEKGSICVNGVSLTCFQVGEGSFRVAIIPYTYEHTTFQHLREGDFVNLEFDIIGKYVQRLLARR